MLTKHSLRSLLACSILWCSSVQAQDEVIETDHFIFTMLNFDNWETKGINEQGNTVTDADIKNSVTEVLNYWSSILGENHKPTSDAGKVTVSLNFKSYVDPNDPSNDDYERIIGSAAPEVRRFTFSSTGPITEQERYYQFTNAYGKNFNSLASSEIKLLGYGAQYGATQVDATSDITINFNQDFNFYYGSVEGLNTLTANKVEAIDFQTILLHEMSHGMGFYNTAITPTDDGSTWELNVDGKDANGDDIIPMTLWDSLMEIDYNNYQPGQVINITGTDLEVYNPFLWRTGSSLGHIDYGENGEHIAVMNPQFDFGQTYREFTEADMALFSAMGWELLPEPSTATLSLLALAGLMARRRRAA